MKLFLGIFFIGASIGMSYEFVYLVHYADEWWITPTKIWSFLLMLVFFVAGLACFGLYVDEQ